jgi:hypothetical protein
MSKRLSVFGGLAVVLTMILSGSSSPSALNTTMGCDVTAVGHDTSITNHVAYEAETREESAEVDCDPISVQAEAWISGVQAPSFDCVQGTSNGYSVCYHWHQDEAQAEIGMWGACGEYLGTSRHWAITPEWIRVGNQDYYKSLWAGRCPQPVIGGPYDDDDPAGSGGSEEFDTVSYFPPNTPIIIPLTQKASAYKLTTASGGVLFDLNADGLIDQTAWTASGSELGFLAIDRNGNGVIDSGSELFGNVTVPGETNGFDALKALNLAMGGTSYPIIDADQPIFSKLLLWEDRNHNGQSEAGELQAFSTLYSDIGLGLRFHKRRDGNGNLFYYRGFAHLRTQAGKNTPLSAQDDVARTVNIYDVIFAR